jgi:hypothetical protein
MKKGENLYINISRENDTKKVWYEWNFYKNDGFVDKGYSQVHNVGGSNYSIIL